MENFIKKTSDSLAISIATIKLIANHQVEYDHLYKATQRECESFLSDATIRNRNIKTANNIVSLAEVGDKLKEKTDEELAKLLIDHIWTDLDQLSIKSAVVEEAIERLRTQHNDEGDR